MPDSADGSSKGEVFATAQMCEELARRLRAAEALLRALRRDAEQRSDNRTCDAIDGYWRAVALLP